MRSKLQNEMKVLMKSGDKVGVETIRSLMSALQYEEIQRGSEQLPESVATDVLQREIKKRKEEIEFAEKGGRADVKARAQQEIAVIERFLPKQLTASELEQIISEMKSGNTALTMGIVMKELKERFSGQYDSRAASDIAKRICG